jgi:hypothetical protein
MTTEKSVPSHRLSLRQLFALITVCCVVFWIVRIANGIRRPVRDADMARIVKGMSKHEVLTILGEPMSATIRYVDRRSTTRKTQHIPDDEIVGPVFDEQWVYKRDFTGYYLFLIWFDKDGHVTSTAI